MGRSGIEKERHFFVDEAGDLALFNKRGKSLLGRAGVSRLFMLGVARIPKPQFARRTLEDLRKTLLDDPYFVGVPSMQPNAKKTYLGFHAKDDVAEVRREVLRLLPQFEAEVFIAIRRKDSLERQARNHFLKNDRKLSEGIIYDSLVKTVFQNLLHQAEHNLVTFARRGKVSRQLALEHALDHAKRRFERKWKKGVDRPITVTTAVPSDSVGLQIVDYYLWAIQRLFERGEDRFFNLLADQYRLIVDLDDRRQSRSGAWYSASKNPLRVQKIMPVAG